MKNTQNLVRVIFVSGIVAVLAYFGLNVSHDQVDSSLNEVVGQVDTYRDQPNSQIQSDSHASPTLQGPYEVVSVIDGDTLVVQIEGQRETVRVVGINAPETEFSRQGAECYGGEAMEYARELLTGKSVYLERDPSQDSIDRFGRILAYVQFEDEKDFGEMMIEAGYAYEFTYRDAYANQAAYRAAEREAKQASAGLWVNCQ